jgi:hypothetical protein
MWRRASIAMLFVFLAWSPAAGQEWAEKMFTQTRHDFGTVARGAKAEYEFVLTNIYLEDVHIAAVRSSCGCTSARIEKPLLKTYEKGSVLATVNTRSFYGQKGATITVTFDRPFYAEVQLHVKSYIRSDVVFHPGSVHLGSPEQGHAADAQVKVDYSGGGDWKILEVKSNDPHISAEAVETQRRYGRVSYNLVVHLDKSAPVGYIDERLLLVSNDRRATQIPVPVEGRVTSAVTVSPASLFLGVVQPGKEVTKQFLVQGSRPFRILAISCSGESFKFDTHNGNVAKRVHLVPLTFVAGENSGRVAENIRIQTDLDSNVAELAAYGVVSPQ